MILNNKGQATIETAVSTCVVLTAVPGILLAVALAITKISASHILYEALVCEQTLPKSGLCQILAKKDLEHISIGSHMTSFTILKSTHQMQANAIFEFPLHMIFKVSESARVPLNNSP